MNRSSISRALVLLSAVTLVAGCRRASPDQSPTPGGGAAQRNATPPAVTPANVAMGDSLFNSGGCMRCHGTKGIGAENGPALNDNQWVQLKNGTFDEIALIITTGVPATAIKDPARKNAMPARGGRMNLSEPQIQAVAAYVYSISHK
jgi:mono/diheme cytochrome c family protein